MLSTILLSSFFPKVLINIINQYYNIDYYEYDDNNVLYYDKDLKLVQYNFMYASLIEQLVKHVDIVCCPCNATCELCKVFCVVCRKLVKDTHITMYKDVVCNKIACFVDYCEYANIEIKSTFDHTKCKHISVHKLAKYNIDPPRDLQYILLNTPEFAKQPSPVYMEKNGIRDEDIFGIIVINRHHIMDKYYPMRNQLNIINFQIKYCDILEYVKLMMHGYHTNTHKYLRSITDYIFDDMDSMIIMTGYSTGTTTINITRFENNFKVTVISKNVKTNKYYLYFSL